jgi:hypothetical protein
MRSSNAPLPIFVYGKFSHMLATNKIRCEFYKGFFVEKNAKLLDFEGKS